MQVIKGELINIADARSLEENKDYEAAANLYEKLLKQSPANLQIIQRLLVLYRKTGDAKNELRTIDRAIAIHQQKYSLTNSLSKKATSISQQLNKMLGHTDKKGKAVLVASEILKLELRKTRVQKKLKPVKSRKG